MHVKHNESYNGPKVSQKRHYVKKQSTDLGAMTHGRGRCNLQGGMHGVSVMYPKRLAPVQVTRVGM